MQTGAGRNSITETSDMARGGMVGVGVDNNTVNNINGQFYAVNGFSPALPPPLRYPGDNNGQRMFMIQFKKCCLCNPDPGWH